jgi:hypothetical protein
MLSWANVGNDVDDIARTRARPANVEADVVMSPSVTPAAPEFDPPEVAGDANGSAGSALWMFSPWTVRCRATADGLLTARAARPALQMSARSSHSPMAGLVAMRAPTSLSLPKARVKRSSREGLTMGRGESSERFWPHEETDDSRDIGNLGDAERCVHGGYVGLTIRR